MNIIKRSGEEVLFNRENICSAINRANVTTTVDTRMDENIIKSIVDYVERQCKKLQRSVHVEEIQDFVEDRIMKLGFYNIARSYIKYRHDKEMARRSNTTDSQILSLIENMNEDVKLENSNKNPTIASVQRDYMAGEVSKDITRRILLPKDVVQAHDNGLIHFHDADYFASHIHNCDLVNLEDMLLNGTVISNVMIEKPHSFTTACNIATQIIAQVASSQYGGQSISLTHLAPFVDITRQKIIKEMESECECPKNSKQFSEIVERRVRKEVERGVQIMQYQVITLQTTNGQAPFVTFFMYLNEAKNEQEKHDLALIIEEVLKQRYIGVKNLLGIYVTPAFPKLIYVLEEDNVKEGTDYWYLTELAAKCTAKRLVPDYISEKIMKEYKLDKNGNGHCYTCMGCRSFLTPYLNDKGEFQVYGRFNLGVVTINLVDVGLSAEKNIKNFWKIFDQRLELCHKALRCRHERLLGTKSDIAPILWQHGALARLNPGEKIDSLLYNGYSTLSLGYAGLWECVMALNGKKLTEPEGEALGLEIMTKLNEYTAKWKEAEHIDYSLYGTPLESTTYKFAKCLQKRFGVIPGITDKSYITNSYHIHVTEQIDAFSKLSLEAKFLKLSPGGAISYVEVPNMQNNIPAVLDIMKFIYDNIMYAELNTKSDYCMKCGFDGEIQVVEDENGKLVWECPQCKNRDQTMMSVARRTCGYIGSSYWNAGRTLEIKERVLHV